jgi:ureidoglycolate hydrolase
MISHEPLKAGSLLDPRLEACGTGLREVDDMTPPGDQDAQLIFGPGQLRYYVMRIPHRPQPIKAMTRHLQATQCLSSAEGMPFWMLLAAPHIKGPVLDASAAWLLKLNPGEGIKLHLGTWHAGPLFEAASASFFNLELADTNQRDHETLSLSRSLHIDLSSYTYY